MGFLIPIVILVVFIAIVIEPHRLIRKVDFHDGWIRVHFYVGGSTLKAEDVDSFKFIGLGDLIYELPFLTRFTVRNKLKTLNTDFLLIKTKNRFFGQFWVFSESTGDISQALKLELVS